MYDFDTIIWDVDGTLLQTNHLYTTARNLFFQHASNRFNIDYSALEAFFIAFDSSSARSHGFAKERFGDSMIATTEHFGVNLTVAQEEFIRYEYGQYMFRNHAPIYDGAYTVLQDLKDLGFQQIAYTAGDFEVQNMRLEQANLNIYFDAIEIVEHKTPERLKELVQVYNYTPVAVGNSLKSDIFPAYKNNIPAIWLHQESWEADHCDEIPLDYPYIAETLYDVFDILINLKNSSSDVVCVA